ncbi:hypothetical protein [Tamlana crocina]|uniref:SGNH hydrolase-type esterase domain-containing protein n=1 Tax=Tamlana crocina TaxID=393006 RepID=A0ABX1DC79_9FLAO|nr:hypothetical protein [Tamlana crocina]NJX15875.1 hypothetical protein [Tamlana crocina]
MKRFLIKLSLFTLSLICVYGFLVNKLSEDYVDIYYKKFTQKASGLIIGISKASKGINPAIIEKKLKDLNYDTPIINFALNVNNSPFGEVYFEAIKKKLNPKQNNQLFIIAVSPGAFAAPQKMNPEDIYKMDKNRTILGKVSQVAANPNYNYVLNTYEQPLYNALHPYEKWTFNEIHDNGWLEIMPVAKKDTIRESDTKFWKSNILRLFRDQLGFQEVSSYRIDSFTKILAYLKSKGDTFIVRIPEDQEFYDLEHKFWPTFERDMDSISNQHDIPFLNYSNLIGHFKTYDGLHLDSTGATEFTKMFSEDIYNYLIKD